MPVSKRSEADLLVVGGGVNGAGIARDAAGRGLSVILCEQADLASATSSASSKLVHGGLRYLEHYEFRLVREALIEREVLLGIAPHIVWPMRFVLPHDGAQRPVWLIRLGLLIYDWLGPRRRLPASRRVHLRQNAVGAPLQERFTTGFMYSDCWVDDSRLVVLNAMDARERGAEILTRTRCLSVRRDGRLWRAELEDRLTGEKRQVSARALVNATGPWVEEMLHQRAAVQGKGRSRLIKGSHLVFPRLYEGEQAYILQNDDRRVIFAIPYEQDFTLVGTTDVAFEGDPSSVAISEAEAVYLCRAVSNHFRTPVTPGDAVHSYSGIRPLYDNEARQASAVTRDYVLDLDGEPGQAPLLSVFGGKITTFRKLAEHAIEKLQPFVAPPRPAPWTARTPLPGGDMDLGFDDFLTLLRAAHPWLPVALARRLAHAYGTRVGRILGSAGSLEALGTDFGSGLYQAEIDYLLDKEWAMSAEDVLWRRSKLGLHLSAQQQHEVARYIAARADV